MAQDNNYVPPGSIDRDAGNVNAGTDPGIPVPLPEPTRPSVYEPSTIPVDVSNAEPLLPVNISAVDVGNAAGNARTIIPNYPSWISVSEDNTLILKRATSLNFTGFVSITTVGSEAIIDIGNGSFGNWSALGNSIYNINGGAIENSDLTHGATSRIAIPPNGSGEPVSLLNYYGNIVLTPSLNPGNTYSWTFDNTGNLVMPTNSASINYANGSPYGGGGGGAQGTTGAQGATGAQGITGVGAQGVQGITGIQGPSDGAQGTQGVQGAIGIQGPSDGAQGIQGATGTQGAVGTQGVQGITGAGTQGATGTGVQGATGAQGASGAASSYGNSNVVSLLAAFGSNTISTTGNVTAGNLSINNITYTGVGPVVITSGNDLDLVAAGQITVNNWTFDGTGNLVMPTNSASINYANGSPYANYSNSNVATLLSNFGSNSISTTGNVTANRVNGNIAAPDGNGSVVFNNSGLLSAWPGFSFDTTANALFVHSANFTGNTVTGVQGLYVGKSNYSILGSDILAQFTSESNTYSQINLQNVGTGAGSSADYIITADNGTDSTYFLDLGLGSSNYSFAGYGAIGPNDGYLFVAGADVAGPYTGTANLNIGSTNGAVRTWIGAGEIANIITTVEPNGLTVNGGRMVTSPKVYANLTAAAGARAFITDGNLTAVGNFGQQVSGGASNAVPVWSDGTNWYIG